ncbi:replication protein A, partial [Staphylococcus aureus]|nr:replication protein A [Staphylococcus aureus]
EQIRCGQGKPNKLYLMNPEITKEDIYEIEKQEENVDEPCHDDEVRKSNFKKFENQTLMILILVILILMILN